MPTKFADIASASFGASTLCYRFLCALGQGLVIGYLELLTVLRQLRLFQARMTLPQKAGGSMESQQGHHLYALALSSLSTTLRARMSAGFTSDPLHAIIDFDARCSCPGRLAR